MSDKITPEQLRKEAVAVERMHGETLTVDWRTKQADQLRAHAAAMTYTAWDYRKLAEYHEQLGNAIIAKHYLAHADALEENARLRAELAKLRANRDFWMESCKQAQQHRDGANEQLAIVEAELAKLRQLVAQQAEDEGLWFNAATAPEAYLQQELRKLHAAVEGTK